MKGINFLNSLSPKQQYALARWYFVSMLLCVTIFIVVAIIQCKQCYSWYLAYREHSMLEQKLTQHHTVITNFTALEAQEKLLAQRQATLKTLTHNQRLIPTYLAAIFAALHTGDFIISCTITTTSLELVINCASTSAALKATHTLQELPSFTDIKLISLQPSNALDKQFSATITGLLQQPNSV